MSISDLIRKRADGEFNDAWRRGNESIARAGFHGWPHRYVALESGHVIGFNPSRATGRWEMTIGHAGDDVQHKSVHVDLGDDHDHVGEAAMQALRRPDVLRSMREQMDPGDNGPWPRRF